MHVQNTDVDRWVAARNELYIRLFSINSLFSLPPRKSNRKTNNSFCPKLKVLQILSMPGAELI
jgi:hypothetical protein